VATVPDQTNRFGMRGTMIVANRKDVGGLACLALLVFGCSGGPQRLMEPANLLPVVRITAAPRDSTIRCPAEVGPGCYTIKLRWTGFDPDGRVKEFRYVIDPPTLSGVDTVWHTTTEYGLEVALSANEVIPGSGTPPFSRAYHVFVITAIDDKGAVGPSVWRAFFSYTQAPDVYIIAPLPSTILVPAVPTVIEIHWKGEDYDAIANRQPAWYKYILLSEVSEVRPVDVQRDPGVLLRRFGPRFSEWDSVPGTVTTKRFSSLVPDHEYLFAIVAIDDAGAYSPVFTFTSNLLLFRSRVANGYGPVITAYNEFFQYTWRSSNCVCPPNELFIEVAPTRPITFKWTIAPPEGADVYGSRWSLDIEDVLDERPRESLQDLRHWSNWSILTPSATVGPFVGALGGVPEQHRLYIQARDNLGFQSLAIIRFNVATSSPRLGSVLIVRDTRLRVDGLDRTTNCAARPLGLWPTQAELDTFLFARGGKRWRCYPTGTVTTPGLFDGYDFDTLGTRVRRQNLSVPLTRLLEHDHVIWLTDAIGARWTGQGDDAVEPQTALRYMCDQSQGFHFNTLIEFMRLGGKLWMAGGGAATATIDAYDNIYNNQPTVTYSSRTTNPELVSGRFLVEYAKWKSEVRISSEPALVKRFTGRHERGPDPGLPYTQYLSELPAQLDFKSRTSDPMPPNRIHTGDFYQIVAPLEYLKWTNRIVETDVHGDTISTLDTLYRASGGYMPTIFENPHNIVMTYYHGRTVPQGLILSGFDLWTFQRAHCKSLVDFVLKRMWGLTPTQGAKAVASSGLEARSGTGRRIRVEPARPGTPDRRIRETAAPARRTRPPGS
jgi:hypothetical protein